MSASQPSSIPTVAVIDYQAGNVRSVEKALERSGARALLTSDAGEIASADGVLFPGQGACDSSMRQLRKRGLVDPIRRSIEGGKPFLGVCLGLQLLLDESDEGSEPCLGVIRGRVRRFPPGGKVPHMGWNDVKLSIDHPVFGGVPREGAHFYFVHSYYADPEDDAIVAGTTSYGLDFCSAVAWDNVAAVQFHPEKSGPTGLRLYSNFVDLVRASQDAG
jgi:glutamine amidotransferase